MAAPRSTSLRTLQLLSQQRTATPSIRRSLHITGVHSAQPANVTDRASLYAVRTLSDLKIECQKRSLRTNGTQPELVERLSNHDFLQSRAFSIAMKRINSGASTETSSRQFNTSRAQKAVNDSSTVDFAYLPSIEEIEAAPARAETRYPILPDIYLHSNLTSGSELPMKPQVYTVSGTGSDVSVSPMSEVVDNASVDIDPFSLTETVSQSRFGEELQRQQHNGSNEPGVVRELWTGFLDDLLGPKPHAQRA